MTIDTATLMTEQEKLSDLLWALHVLAQDASNEPSSESLKAVRDTFRKFEKQVPLFWW